MANRQIIQSNLVIAGKVIDFLAAEFTNPQKFQENKAILQKFNSTFNIQNAAKFQNLGFFSILECTLFLANNETSPLNRVIDETYKALEEKNLIYREDRATSNFVDERFRFNGENAANLYRRDLIFNIILGFDYIIQKYKQCVVKIEVENQHGDKDIGTGFIAEWQNEKFLVTNKHVLESNESFVIYDYTDTKMKYGNPFLHSKKDLAIIPVKDFDFVALDLNLQVEILADIITIGYPSIPMSNYAYQVFHKGEVNSFIKDYQENDLFLISAKTSSGNSGSPVIDEKGTVVGIVTEELFEKEKFYNKGKLPYYAAIASKDIVSVLYEYKLSCRNEDV